MSFSSIFFNRYSGYIHWWEFNEEGKKIYSKERAPLYFFKKSEDGDYKSIYGDKLKKIEFDDFNKYREAKDMYRASGTQLFESDVDIDHRFVIDKYSNKDLKIPKFDIHYIDIEVHSERGFPSVDKAEHPITILTIYSSKHDRFFVFSEKDFDKSFLPENSWVKVFNNEVEMLKTFISFIKKSHPDFLTGWNSSGFDIPYIINRCFKILGEEETRKISPINNITKVVKKLRFGKQKETYDIGGINCIDYLDLYKKYQPGERESFKLDYICKTEINEQKLKFEGTLKDLYHNNWQKYVEYNVQDVMLLKKLDAAKKYMNLMVTICYNCRTPFNKFEKTTRILDGAFISRLSLERVILPDVIHTDENEGQFAGAFVKDPDVGMYDWVMSFDATSLYPSIMMQHNISPETKVKVVNAAIVPTILDALEGNPIDTNELALFATENQTVDEIIKEIKEKNYTIASNGAIYRHDIGGIVPKFTKEWFDNRIHHKKLMQKAKKEGNAEECMMQDGYQSAMKILINSVYGGIGSKYFRLYDRDNAVAVTATGQDVIKAAMNSMDSFFSKWETTDLGKKLNAKNVNKIVIAGDTDSGYFNIGAILKSFNYPHFNDNQKCKEFLEAKIEPLLFKIINSAMQNLTQKRMNCSDCKITFKREMIARRACFLAKKRYIAWVLKYEEKDVPTGDKDEIKAKGIEMIKSSTPEIVRDLMHDFNSALIKNVDPFKANNYIREIHDKFKNADLEQIAKITNVNGIEKYTGSDGMPIKNCPYHVKASIGYNMLIDKHNLEDAFEKIYEGDKVKIVFVKESPSYPFNVIAFKDELPEDFNMNKMVDYDIMWNKVFVEPIKPLYEVMKWSLPNFEQVDIADLFS